MIKVRERIVIENRKGNTLELSRLEAKQLHQALNDMFDWESTDEYSFEEEVHYPPREQEANIWTSPYKRYRPYQTDEDESYVR